MDTISRQTARRYVLGRQGLWPGRRWVGKEGAAAAIRQAECVQVDPINAVGRSHDIALFSRVEGYEPAMLDALLYHDRALFDYGSILLIHPLADLPAFRAVMARNAARRAHHRETKQALFDHVLGELRARGPLASRDFGDRQRVRGGWGTIKDTWGALHHLWLAGELMTHGRRGSDRLYALAADVVGEAALADALCAEEADRHIARKALRDLGLATRSEWGRRAAIMMHRPIPPAERRACLPRLVEVGQAVALAVEGRGETCYAQAEDLPLLDTLEAGGVPETWRPVGPTTQDEVTLLAPLDSAIWDRRRALALFDFDYVWEVYKPEAQRRWGYYTLPVLWGDLLAARVFPRLDRKARALTVAGLWLDDPALAHDPAFTAALAAGLRRFAQ